jgi:hypothetical protein
VFDRDEAVVDRGLDAPGNEIHIEESHASAPNVLDFVCGQSRAVPACNAVGR